MSLSGHHLKMENREDWFNGSLNLSFVFDKIVGLVIIPFRRCGVEQRQLVGLITRRSQVRILSPLPKQKSTQIWVLFLFRNLTVFLVYDV